MNKYVGLFDDRQSVIDEFFPGEELPDDFPADEDILIASYDVDDYSGEAFVLFERDGRLFEVNGSHCSCHGLEEQWDPEETTAGALKIRRCFGEEVATFLQGLVR